MRLNREHRRPLAWILVCGLIHTPIHTHIHIRVAHTCMHQHEGNRQHTNALVHIMGMTTDRMPSQPRRHALLPTVAVRPGTWQAPRGRIMTLRYAISLTLTCSTRHASLTLTGKTRHASLTLASTSSGESFVYFNRSAFHRATASSSPVSVVYMEWYMNRYVRHTHVSHGGDHAA